MIDYSFDLNPKADILPYYLCEQTNQQPLV